MFKKISLPLIMVAILALLAGCMDVGSAADSNSSASIYIEDIDTSIYYAGRSVEEEPATVEYQEHLNYIRTEELSRLMSGVSPSSTERESYDQYTPEWHFVLIDSRPTNVYHSGHINGAISIPDSEFSDRLDLLPKDKDKMLIFYCGGLQCEFSAMSANKALDLGYSNVYVYQEGLPFWLKAGNYLSVTEKYVEQLIMESYVTNEKNNPYIIIDSRTYPGYFEGHIPGAIFMNDAEYEKYKALVPADKNADIVIYCGGFFCHKSHQIAENLVIEGYKNVKVLSGGMPAWKKAGLPTFGSESSGGDFDVSEGVVDRSLTPASFEEKISGSNVVVLDVRSADERNAGAIPDSIHIPNDQINADPEGIKGQLPSDANTTILIHCASGGRASGVVDKIADLGYENAFYLNNTIKISSDGTYSFD